LSNKNEKTMSANNGNDFLPLIGTDYVEFYVGNAKQAAYYYQTAWGFQPMAYSGLETGNKLNTSYVLRQGDIILVMTSALTPESPVAEHHKIHGDGIKVIAFTVEDATYSFNETVKRGAKPYMEPKVLEDENGKVVISGVYTYGETVHIFVERKNYKGVFMPGFQKWETEYKTEPVGVYLVDHAVGNVGWGEMKKWAEYYEKVFGFTNLIT